jgi:excinuclease ABC subunit C
MEEMIHKLSDAPSNPGVYLMKDADGRVIYVGKAKNLKKRLAAYVKKTGPPDPKTGVLISKIHEFETIVTESENDALILESNLIKRHRPRYNVILKDDKRYPSLRLNLKKKYPHLEIVRKIENDGSLYFGPFSSPPALYQTLKIINKTFKLRKCRDTVFKSRVRPCLNHQIGRCLGPCCLDVDEGLYDEMVNEVVLFLKGRTPELIQKTRAEMTAAAECQDFEKAAEFRDKMFSLERVIEKQLSVASDFVDRDFIGMARSDEHSVMTVLSVRSGKLIDSRHFHFNASLSTDPEMLEAFIRQYYERVHAIPKETALPLILEEADLLEEWLKTVKGERVKLLHPVRGEKAGLLNLAEKNAGEELRQWTSSAQADRQVLERLQKRLRLNRLPLRIECFDNSNLSGTSPVAGMAVFVDGRPHKPGYRTYAIRTVQEPDDYASMAEVLKRRFGKDPQTDPFPDLLMVDGGKGQLNIAAAVIGELGLQGRFDIIGIAKKNPQAGETEDKIYKPGRANPLPLAREEGGLLFLQRIRDEAHRFAVAFHRRKRTKKTLTSALDEISGVGRQRKKALLEHFGSIQKIRAAAPDELCAVPGISPGLAQAIHRAFQPEDLT